MRWTAGSVFWVGVLAGFVLARLAQLGGDDDGGRRPPEPDPGPPPPAWADRLPRTAHPERN